MKSISALIAAAAASLPILATAQNTASPGGDLCERFAAAYQTAQDGDIQLVMDREVASYVVKHTQRACRRLDDLARNVQTVPSGESIKARLGGVAARLHAEVLTPIYRRHLDLRGQDLTAQGPGRIEQDTRPGEGEVRKFGLTLRPGQLERESAVRLGRTLSDLTAIVLALGTECAKDANPADREQIKQTTLNIVAELTWADNPVYASFPDLWDEKLRADRHRAMSRTAASDAAFRKDAPAPGAVHLSPTVVAQGREILKELERKTGVTDSVIALIWTSSMEVKGPNDSAWKSLGPHLTMGSYYREQVPPDVIRVIEDVPFMFVGNGTFRFDGKLIDYQDGKLVLRDP